MIKRTGTVAVLRFGRGQRRGCRSWVAMKAMDCAATWNGRCRQIEWRRRRRKDGPISDQGCRQTHTHHFIILARTRKFTSPHRWSRALPRHHSRLPTLRFRLDFRPCVKWPICGLSAIVATLPASCQITICVKAKNN
jgi:hypothetical protein